MDFSEENYGELVSSILAGSHAPSTEELVEILTKASDVYHNADSTNHLFAHDWLLDSHYDALELLLRALDPNNAFLQTVGSDVRGGKVDLPHQLGSLDQNYEGDTIKWVRAHNWQNQQFVITDKEDGNSGLLCYGRGGKFTISYSRGNGIQGSDTTRHITKIQNFVNKLPCKADIRVEVMLDDHVFDNENIRAQAAGERTYKNARNYVSGKMNASVSPDWFYRNVRIVATSVVEPKMGKLEQLEFLQSVGFEVPHYVIKKGNELTDDFLIPYLQQRRQAVKGKGAIDGIVIDLDDSQLRESLRRNSSSINPMYSRKFKVGSDDNLAQATVVKVHYKPSKAGYVKPRIEIVPVNLVGVTITYLTGFNAKFIRDSNIGPGAVIEITRRGDVIPFVQRVITPAAAPQLPTQAEFGSMTWTDNEVDLVLLDQQHNKQVQLNTLISTFDISGLNVPFLKEGSVEKLYDAGYTTAASIIRATESQLQTAVGQSAGSKIYEGLKKVLNPVKLHVLAGSSQTMGRGIGRRKMAKLIETVGEDAVLLNQLTEQQIVGVESFEATTARLVVANLPKFLDFLQEIQSYYTLDRTEKQVVQGKLTGSVFVFTGFRDSSLKAAIEAQGGEVKDTPSKDMTHIVAVDKNGSSSKLQKAKAKGIEPMNIAEVKALLG